MTRRKVLLALGGASAIGGAVLGTDAFTSVEADRAIEVNVAGDAKALLALEPASGKNGAYATTEGGTLEIDLSTDEADGVNPDAKTVVRDVFRITNQGTQPVGVWIEHGSDHVTFEVGGSPVEGERQAVVLEPGESTMVGLTVDSAGTSAGETVLKQMTVHATTDIDKGPVGGGGGGGSDPSIDATRTLSTKTAKSGDEIRVTIAFDPAARRDVDIYERFDEALGTATLDGVTVDGTTVSPAFADFEDNGGIVLLSDVGPGTVELSYTITVAGASGTYRLDPTTIDVGSVTETTTERQIEVK